jgi:hypothetical protein
VGAASFYMLKKIGLYIMCIICRGTVNFFNTRFQNIWLLVLMFALTVSKARPILLMGRMSNFKLLFSISMFLLWRSYVLVDMHWP